MSDCAVHNEPAEPNGRCNCVVRNYYDENTRPAQLLVCPDCGNWDPNYGSTGCDNCEKYGEDFYPIRYWKYLGISAIKQ